MKRVIVVLCFVLFGIFILPTMNQNGGGSQEAVVPSATSVQTMLYNETTFRLSVPTETLLGTEVPINFTMEGGFSNIELTFQVTAPSNQKFNASEPILVYPDEDGYYSTIVTYPNSFPNATQAAGNYTIAVNVTFLQVSPLPTTTPSPTPEQLFSYQISPMQSRTFRQFLGTIAVTFALYKNNTAPLANITSIVPNPAVKGETVTFVGVGEDADGTIANYSWVSNVDGFLSSNATFFTSSLSVGSHNITFRVEDNLGLFSPNATVTLTVTDAKGNDTNVTPTAYLDSELPQNITKGQSATFSGHGVDLDGIVVAYRWESNLDGLLATTMTATVSNLSVGTHVITFRVQDDMGEWSEAVTQEITVSESGGAVIDPVVVAVAAGCAAVIAGAASYQAFRFRQRKNKDQKPTIPKIRKLSLKAKIPKIVMPGATTQIPVEIKNIGTTKLANIALSAFSTPGLTLNNHVQTVPELEVGGQESVTFSVQPDEAVDRGFYTFRLETGSQGFPVMPKSYPLKVCRIGLLVQNPENVFASSLQKSLRSQNYAVDQVRGLNSLSDGLLKYDLLIVPPDSSFSSESAKNLVSYVKSGQSVLLLGEIKSDESTLLEQIFGYAGPKSPSLPQSTLKISNNQHSITKDFQPKEFQITCQPSFWQNQLTTAQPLAFHCNLEGEILTPAISVNDFGRGHAAHFDLEVESFSLELWGLLKNTIDWLLTE